jgi:hypothetical protein
MKAILPWLLVVGLGVGLAVVYLNSQKQAAELTQLRADSQELQTLKASVEEAKKNQSEGEGAELAKLREDNKDLLRLRNEVQQLRAEKADLSKRMQTAQQQSEQATAQAQAAQAQAQSFQQAAQSAQAQAAALRVNAAPEARAGVCINYMRQIDAAKQQWALQNGKTADAMPTPAELVNYLPNKTMPVCPGGGTYSLNAVNAKTSCNIAGHVQP